MRLSFIPNAICIVRGLLIVPIAALLISNRYTEALILIVVAGISDAVDGYLAKTFDWRSRLGGMLDPAADKLLVTGTFVTLTYTGLIPAALTFIVVLRDLVVLAGAIVYQLCFGRVRPDPTVISKLNTACQLAFLVFTITNAQFSNPPADWVMLLGAAVVFTSVTSAATYIWVWSKKAAASRRSPA